MGALRLARNPERIADLGMAEDSRQRAREVLRDAARQGVRAIGYFDAEYPEALREITSAPPVLWVRGQKRDLHQKLVAVVGTRRPTVFGQAAARSVVESLPEDVGVVSGLARGVDSAAHQTALERNRFNVAVLGCGLDDEAIYPAENLSLAQQVLDQGGCLVSEHPPGTPVTTHYLIARNRIQTGLSIGCVLVQSDASGGTPYTAAFAMRQQRRLWCCVPRNGDWTRAEANRILTGQPARLLPELIPAFQAHARACQQYGDQPLALPLAGDQLAAWAEELTGEDQPSSLF